MMLIQDTGQLSVNNLTKIYPNSKNRKALDSVTFSVPTRGIFVLIGRNGSGKTTLVRILSTELELTSGSADVNGIDVMRQANVLRQRIAIVPQESRTVPWMTPLQTVSSYLLWRGFDYSYAIKRALETLERFGLEDSAKRLNRTLSGGNRRKVLVATVLASEADIIFLDEPTTGLDPISRREFWNFLREIGSERFTFLTTHYLEEAEELATEIGVLDRGKLVAVGTLDQLRNSISYNYSMKIPLTPSLPPNLTVQNGEVFQGRDGYRILTIEDEAFRISRELSRMNYRFAINPVSLDDIFFYLINRQGGADSESNGRRRDQEEQD